MALTVQIKCIHSEDKSPLPAQRGVLPYCYCGGHWAGMTSCISPYYSGAEGASD